MLNDCIMMDHVKTTYVHTMTYRQSNSIHQINVLALTETFDLTKQVSNMVLLTNNTKNLSEIT